MRASLVRRFARINSGTEAQMNRYIVRGFHGSMRSSKMLIDAENLADLERKLREQGFQWTSIEPYISMARATI